MRRRLGATATIVGVAWGERRRIGEATVSFHPAGHVLGSSQIRIEGPNGEVWVFTGDYKRSPDPSCEAFEVVPCDVLISEATFALPIYRWPSMDKVMAELLGWWDTNRAAGRASVLFCYALGKAQRLLAEIAARREATVYVHGAIEPMVEAYREAGVALAKTVKVADVVNSVGETRLRQRKDFSGELILAPTSAFGSTWMRRFGDASTAFASGWMRVRGVKRWRGFDRGFVVSDHVDWDQLIQTVTDTGATRVLLTHGYTDAVVRYLREAGIHAAALQTAFEGEGGIEEAGPARVAGSDSEATGETPVPPTAPPESSGEEVS